MTHNHMKTKRGFHIGREEEIKKLYLSGLSCQDIVDELKLEVGTRQLMRFVNSLGITRNYQERRDCAKARGKLTFNSMRVKNPYHLYRRPLNTALRYKVLERDGFRCVLCGSSRDDGITLQVDHIVRQALGGKNDMSNLRTLCHHCNLGRDLAERGL